MQSPYRDDLVWSCDVLVKFENFDRNWPYRSASSRTASWECDRADWRGDHSTDFKNLFKFCKLKKYSSCNCLGRRSNTWKDPCRLSASSRCRPQRYQWRNQRRFRRIGFGSKSFRRKTRIGKLESDKVSIKLINCSGNLGSKYFQCAWFCVWLVKNRFYTKMRWDKKLSMPWVMICAHQSRKKCRKWLPVLRIGIWLVE